MQIIDNINTTVKGDLQSVIHKGSKLSIAAACFSIYAYQELKKQLEGIDELRFIFTSPTFVTERTPKAQREFYIPRISRERSLYGTEFEVKLRNELTQKAIAKECADWIRRKVTFKSNVTGEQMMGFMTVDQSTYMPISGFTTVDLGCERGNNAYYPVQKTDSYENANYFLNLFEQLWNDKKKLQEVTDAFGDFAKLLLPKTIVFCEGDPNGGKRKDFDKTIYSTIFSDTHPEAFFISGGSCNDIENIEKTSGEIIQTLLTGTKVIKIVDRDDRSLQEVADLAKTGIKVLNRRNLESYVLDDAVIKKLCDKVGKPEEYVACIQEKQKALTDSVSRGNAPDDFKKASGGIYISLKRRLSLTQCGNNPDPFMRDTLAPLITPDMDVYKELEAEIFGDDNDDNNGGTTNG